MRRGLLSVIGSSRAVIAVTLAAVCAALLTDASAAPAAAAQVPAALGVSPQKAAGTWGTAKEVPGLAGLATGNYAETGSISCASPGNCAVGGDYYDSSHNVQPFVASEDNGRWSDAREVAASLNRGGPAAVSSVSCVSPGNCSAGGYYTDYDGMTQAFVVDETSGSWGDAQEVPGSAKLDAGGDGANVNSVSCASAGNCSAGGAYVDKSSNIEPFIVSEKNGHWGDAQEVGGSPAGPTSGQGISSVSCASAGNCAATGSQNSGQAFVVDEVKGDWGAAQEVGSDTLNSVSCASAGDCVAVGNDGSAAIVVDEVKGAWGAAKEVGGSTLNSVSCATAGNCSAVGGGGGSGIAVDETGGKWGAAKTLAGTDLPLITVSCASAGNCSAGGGPPEGSGDSAFLVNETDGKWQGGQSVRGSASVVWSVSCAAPGNCGAAGDYYDGAAKEPYGYGFVVSQTTPVVGIYSDFNGTDKVTAALNDGWSMLADVAGLGSPKNAAIKDKNYRQHTGCKTAWVGSTHSDDSVAKALGSYQQDHPVTVPWISYWTPAVPAYGTDLTKAGYATGRYAAEDIAAAQQKGKAVPVYVALDFEYSAPKEGALSCGEDKKKDQKKPKDKDKQCWDWSSKEKANCFPIKEAGWQAFADGWAEGVQSVSGLSLSPALYVNGSEYKAFNLSGIGLPVIIAATIPLPAEPDPAGAPIVGYAVYYAACGHASSDVTRLKDWGASYNSVQFAPPKSVICKA